MRKKIQAYIPLNRQLQNPITEQHVFRIVQLSCMILIQKYHNCDTQFAGYAEYKNRVSELMFNELPPESAIEDTLWDKMAKDPILIQLTQQG